MLKSLLNIARFAASSLRERAKSKRRSSRWDEVRDEFLETNGRCAACGSTSRLQVHHIEPFHLHPELELDPKNLISLCMGESECHLKIGHGGSFKRYNPGVVADAKKHMAAKDDQRRALIVERCRSRSRAD